MPARNFDPGAFRVCASFALGPDGRSFKGAKASHFFEDSFRFQLRFEPFEGPVDGFSFLDGYFWHEIEVQDRDSGDDCRAGRLAQARWLSIGLDGSLFLLI